MKIGNLIIVSSIILIGFTTNVAAQNGKQIYKNTCVSCHGINGKGSIPGAPDFTDPNGPLKNSNSVLLNRVVNGFESHGSPIAMPPKGGNPALTRQELQKTIEYIRRRFGKKQSSSLKSKKYFAGLNKKNINQSNLEIKKNKTYDKSSDSNSIKAEIIARGARAWASTCSGCHNLRDPKSFNTAQWNTITQHMRVQAHLSGQKTREILMFLQNTSK